MKLQRLAPGSAFTINQIITGGKTPPGVTKSDISKITKESEKMIEEHFKVKNFDIYLAVTLRNVNDFINAERTALILEDIYGFTVAYPGGLGLLKDTSPDDSSNEKGDLERFFIEKSKSLLMFEAEKMSVGKYFETAIAVLSKKPVAIVFSGFKNREEMKILKTRNPIKTLGTASESFGFHVDTLSTVLHCLSAELGMDEHFGKDFRSQLNETSTGRSRNGYCPLCKSLLVRKSFWATAKEYKEKKEKE